MLHMEKLDNTPVIRDLRETKEILWLNPDHVPFAQAQLALTAADIDDAERRLQRFAPLIMKHFPEPFRRRESLNRRWFAFRICSVFYKKMNRCL